MKEKINNMMEEVYKQYNGCFIDEIHLGIGKNEGDETFYIVDVLQNNKIIHLVTKDEAILLFEELKKKIR